MILKLNANSSNCKKVNIDIYHSMLYTDCFHLILLAQITFREMLFISVIFFIYLKQDFL
jgi:hypothetical protein